MIIHPEAVAAFEAVKNSDRIKGWFGSNSVLYAANMALVEGDQLEIGTYYGASAIAAALVKKRLGIPGKIICIDPFKMNHAELTNRKEYRELTPETVLDNAKHFGVELELIVKPSLPWPDELAGRSFATAYIDGDHRFPHPGWELVILANRVTTLIGLDDVSAKKPHIVEAISLLTLERLDWTLIFLDDNFALLSRYVRKPPLYVMSANIDKTFDYSKLSSGRRE